MKVKELMALLERVEPEQEVVVGKIENNTFKTAYIPESVAVLKKRDSDETLCCIFYEKTIKKHKNNEKDVKEEEK